MGTWRGGSNEYLCFGAKKKKKKKGIFLQTSVFLYDSGVYVGIHFTEIFSDVKTRVYYSNYRKRNQTY